MLDTNAQIRLHRLYTSAFGRTVRLLSLVALFLWAQDIFSYHRSPNIFVFIMNFGFMVEIFFHFKIGVIHPSQPLSASPEPLYNTFSPDALFLTYGREMTEILRDINRYPAVRFLLVKATILPKEIQVKSIPVDQLYRKAAEVARQVHGTYLTTMDIMVAYLLITEEQSGVLFKKGLKEGDLLHILSWARSIYRDEEQPKKIRVSFTSEGLGETIVSGWTPETKNYTRNFTTKAWTHRPLLVGREQDFQRLLEALSKPENNNVILVGESGIGKETMVEAFAYDSSEGILGGGLDRKKVLQIMVGQLIAGAQNRSDLELRLQAIVEEVSHAGNVLIYIPEFQEMVGGGSYDLNLAGALLPYLQDGYLPVIATLTPGNYKKYIEPSSLTDAFTVIFLEEPDVTTALHMLFEKTVDIERKTGTSISYKAVEAAVTHARRYLPDSQLPGSAVQLLEDVAHAIGSTRATDRTVYDADVLSEVSRKTHVTVGVPQKEEKELLLHLEEFLHQRIIGQDTAILAISESLRRLRSGLTSTTKPTSFLFLGPTGVGKTETAKALAEAYYGGEDHMLRFDMSEYIGPQGLMRLLGSPPGAGDERGELTEKVHDNPSSLILLDEFEKADPQVLNLFLQVFEDGRLTDNKGKTVSFSDTIIIATSNAGSEFIREQLTSVTEVSQFKQPLLDFLQSNSLFKPELLNRFDDVIVFTPLSDAEMGKVAQLLLSDLRKTLEKQDITVIFTPEIIEKIVHDGVNREFGARPLRRYIQDTIEDRIAKMKLQDVLPRGSTITFSVDTTGALTHSIVPYAIPQVS